MHVPTLKPRLHNSNMVLLLLFTFFIFVVNKQSLKIVKSLPHKLNWGGGGDNTTNSWLIIIHVLTMQE